mmetsp:Transcript_12928/g.23458  ORF Transcript_12928/g.23458 Transcript_12928/m.23458 type:complete len:201 (-) Transcript_12928:536-1138(-)
MLRRRATKDESVKTTIGTPGLYFDSIWAMFPDLVSANIIAAADSPATATVARATTSSSGTGFLIPCSPALIHTFVLGALGQKSSACESANFPASTASLVHMDIFDRLPLPSLDNRSASHVDELSIACFTFFNSWTVSVASSTLPPRSMSRITILLSNSAFSIIEAGWSIPLKQTPAALLKRSSTICASDSDPHPRRMYGD